MNLLWRNIARTAQRKLLEPQPIEITPLQDMFHVTAKVYEFAISRKPQANLIYTHDCSTPSAVLKKPGIHILPESMPELNKREKYSAVARQLEASYENSFKNCKTPKETFHLERKIRSQVRSKLFFIGCLGGSKYRHLLRFKSLMETLAQNTQREYQKNGVQVQALGQKIYPSGKVWMPTSEKYLYHYQYIINSINGSKDMNFLDLGCGSGVLSFLFSKQFKKGRVCAIDNNPDAVKTCNLNAARLNYRNVEAVHFDLKHQKDFQLKTMEYKFPKSFDWIVINPPWLIASKSDTESALTDGVYDHSQMLKSALKLSHRILAADGRIILIYSDLSQLLGLSQPMQQLCAQSGLLIQQKYEQLLHEEMVKKSAISEFKSKSKIITYLLRKS